MATAVGDLVVRLGAQTRQFDSRMRRSTGAIRVMTGAAHGLGRALALALGPVVGVVGLIRLARAGETFNQKMRQSLAIMGDVSDAMRKDMQRAAFETAAVTKFSAAEMGEAYYYLASAGLNAAQSIKALPAVAQFAQAGMFNLARATELATDAQHALGMASADPVKNLRALTRVTDVLVKANTLADATTEQFAESLTQKAGAAFKIVGKDIEEVVAVLAALAMAGRKGEEAGTQLSRVMIGLKSNAINNAAAFKRLGITVFDEAEKMRNLADIVEDLENSLGRMTNRQQQAAIEALGFTKKNADLVALLIGMSDKIRMFEGELRKAGGTARDVADNQLTHLQKGWAKLGTTATETGAAMMKALGPQLRTAMEGIADAISWIAKSFLKLQGGVAVLFRLHALIGEKISPGGFFTTFRIELEEEIKKIEAALAAFENKTPAAAGPAAAGPSPTATPHWFGPTEEQAVAGARIIETMRTPLEKYNAQVADLMRLWQVGALGKDFSVAERQLKAYGAELRKAANTPAIQAIAGLRDQVDRLTPGIGKAAVELANFSRMPGVTPKQIERFKELQGQFGKLQKAEKDAQKDAQKRLAIERSVETAAERMARERAEIERLFAPGSETRKRALAAVGGGGEGPFGSAAERGSQEAWTRVLAAMSGGKKDPVLEVSKDILKENREQTVALKSLDGRSYDQDMTEIPP